MATGHSKLGATTGSLDKKKRYQMIVRCWNMRTLVEAEGPIETSVVRPGGRGVTVATLMVREFKKYGVQLAGTCISETKWFGEAIYQVDGHTIWSTCP